MDVRFLLGPAGSGKTFRCLAEIRDALARSPEGPPLVFLAPKQATFQIERQLLEAGGLRGYTRLHVLSFDRLAQFTFDCFEQLSPPLLSPEGRIMVLRALLRRHERDLTLLRASARRRGFAQEVAGQLAELQQHQFSPAKLRALAGTRSLRRDLQDKLQDLALLSEKYSEWLLEHDLQDANRLLDIAAENLRSKSRVGALPFFIQELWLDGFAEMTPQEHALLGAVIPFCSRATLAFCLETEPVPAPAWLSIWSAIGQTYQRCRSELAALPGCRVEVRTLDRRVPGKSRFAADSPLAALEESWPLPVAGPLEFSGLPGHLAVTACPNPEAEAVFAAHEVLKFVRQGHRFRDCAVLVRSLDNYDRPLAQAFRRCEIPFFLDRRESVTHHPLAELTRNALRTVAYDWQHDDWFAALKAGFSPVPEMDIDRLENLALEYGWQGRKWREPLPDDHAERLRQALLPPFDQLYRRLKRQQFQPTGPQLADALAELWAALKVESTLADWSAAQSDSAPPILRNASLHQTVFDQMVAWLENVALAFPRDPMPLSDWLPVLEAALGALTVGVIPPALDEVTVGAIDRARNPELKFVLLLGFNDGVFPAPPPAPVILTHADRNELEQQDAAIGLNILHQSSRERFLAYIACTRASRRLSIAFSRQDSCGGPLNPSPFLAHLQRNFPQLALAEFSPPFDWRQAQHPVELIPSLPRLRDTNLPALPGLQSLEARLAKLREPAESENLSAAIALRLYGPVLKSSVSRLEEFAQCPFRFFVHSGLRVEERKKFELDARERGSFQHEVLRKFHDDLVAENKRWRDLAPAQARQRVGQIAAELAPGYRQGLFHADPRNRFAARALTAALQDFIETLVVWMRAQYDFNPARAEVAFGLEASGLPDWRIDLGHGQALALRGRVDRIDLCPDGDRALAVVMDYKSSNRKLDKLYLAHGIQLQLPAYLAALRRWPPDFLGAKKIVPAGVFYVNLRGQFESGSSRAKVLADAAAARLRAYRHSGRFDSAFLAKLDRAGARDQFNYQINADGSLRANSAEALTGEDFAALLDAVEEQMRSLGRRIFTGEAKVDPYRKGTATACDYCDCRAVCRIDDWTHAFRELRPEKAMDNRPVG